jgi:hypothetical protein
MPRPQPKSVPLPPQPAYLPEQRVAELASRLLRTLGVARALAESGRELDLRGIEDGVGQLCAQTLDLPTPEARCMVVRLREVLGQVDTLTEIFSRTASASTAKPPARTRQVC